MANLSKLNQFGIVEKDAELLNLLDKNLSEQ